MNIDLTTAHDTPYEARMRPLIEAFKLPRDVSKFAYPGNPKSLPWLLRSMFKQLQLFPLAYEYRITQSTSTSKGASAKITPHAFLWTTKSRSRLFLFEAGVFTEVTLYELERKLSSMQQKLLIATIKGDTGILRALRYEQTEARLALIQAVADRR